MPRYERMPLHEESTRAPPGVCELSVQSTKDGAFDYAPELQSALSQYVEDGLEVKAFEYDEPEAEDRMVVYTGTDRLDIATLRDISEVYGQITNYTGGNIPPEISLVPTSRGDSDERYFAWLEFKLQMELPLNEVQRGLEITTGGMEVVPKNPVGERMEAIVFRDGNMANNQVRRILKQANNIRDALPIDYIRLVCEPKE